MDSLCRDCLCHFEAPAGSEPGHGEAIRCLECASPRVIAHKELHELSIAHIDCDAFYAAIEKRDRPELLNQPLIIGGAKRGVVSTACYVARVYGIHSAMPMFKALRACPHATVLPPDMAKYAAVGREVRELMRGITPIVEPLSIDEAFLDLSGTERLHGQSPAVSLAGLAKTIEEKLDLTVSIGLSYNKSLAKIASDLDKPRGYSVIGRAEAMTLLAGKPVSIIWGVGKALQKNLAKNGVTRVRDLHRFERDDLVARFGAMGRRLYAFSRGEDHRAVEPNAPTKSISAETTFNEDLADLNALLAKLWPLSEKVARRLKAADLAGATVTLKLKTKDFRQLTRSRKLHDPTRLAEEIYRTAALLLEAEADGRFYRLIGVGVTDLVSPELADLPDLSDPGKAHRAKVEEVLDEVRAKLGPDAIEKGRRLALSQGDKIGAGHPKAPRSSRIRKIEK